MGQFKYMLSLFVLRQFRSNYLYPNKCPLSIYKCKIPILFGIDIIIVLLHRSETSSLFSYLYSDIARHRGQTTYVINFSLQLRLKIDMDNTGPKNSGVAGKQKETDQVDIVSQTNSTTYKI